MSRRNGAAAGAPGPALAEWLEREMGRRAAAVDPRPPQESRRALEHRLAGRAARRRRRRAGALVGIVAVATALVVVRAQRPSDVVAGEDGAGPDRVSAAAPGSGVRTAATDDPAELGLPRLVLGAGSGLRPQLGSAASASGIAAVVDLPPSPIAMAQVFHPPDALLPLVVAPWVPSAADQPMPTAGRGGWRAVRLGADARGDGAVLHGTAPDWVTLAWTLPDGVDAYVSAHGVAEPDLLELAAGVRHPPGPAAEYEVDAPPAGMVEERVVVASPSTGGEYGIVYVDGGGATLATLRVTAAGAGGWIDDVTAALATASGAEARSVGERPAVATRTASGWLVVWEPAAGVTARLQLSSTSRADLDRVLGAVEVVDEPAWTAHVDDARD